MIKRLLLDFIPVLLIALLSCDEESPTSSQFIIISNSGNPINGIVSTYSSPSKTFEEEVFRFSSTTFRSEITAAVLSENDLYILKRDDSTGPDKVEVVNASTWTDFRSTDLHLVAHFSRIAILNDKVFVAGSSLDGYLHLLVFNKATLVKEDSVYLGEYAEIREMIAHDNKIYISYNIIDGNPKVLVLNSLDYEVLDKIELPDVSEDLVVDLEGNILAFHRTGCIKINSSTLTLTPIEIPEGNVFYGPGRSSFGFDKKKNIVYYFTYAAQPAPALFHLSGFNLTSEEPVDIPREFIDGSSIDFNNRSGQIVIGARHDTNQGVVRLCKTNGKIIDDFFVPNTPLKILFNP